MSKKKLIIIIIIIAAAVALVVAGAVFGLRIFRRLTHEPVDTSLNATIIEFNVGRTVNEADLSNAENIIRDIAGDRFRSLEKTEGHAPMLKLEHHGYEEEELAEMPEEECEALRKSLIGDRLIITCLLLTKDESMDLFTALALHFEFDFENYNYTGEALHNHKVNHIFKAGLE
ncbi:MAG: hypothetical protein FWH24_02900 [Oscillospiraceae bacterium]|nr:hypothetical protein [Oscillospiraceae bacterium]